MEDTGAKTITIWNPFGGLNEAEAPFPTTPVDVTEISSIGATAREILTDLPPPKSSPHTAVHGMEVGDDRVELSQEPFQLALGLAVQEKLFGMKTSWKDTFISTRLWNFCETTSSIPHAKTGSYQHARRTGDLENLEFTDAPPLRLLMEVKKGVVGDFSSSSEGKAATLATRLNTPRRENRPTLMLASVLQDGLLRTAYMSDPKYLPVQVGGCGCRALFDDPVNLLLSVKAFHGGGYDRVYGSAIEEARQAVRRLDVGIPSELVLCKRLRDKHEYLYGTYSNLVLLPQARALKQALGETYEPLYEAQGTSNGLRAFEVRLERARLICGQTEAATHIGQKVKVEEQLFGLLTVPEHAAAEKIAKQSATARYAGALTGNTAFKHLLDRQANPGDVAKLVEEGFLPVDCGLRAFGISEARWVVNGCKGGTFSIYDIGASERHYAVEDVSLEKAFKIGGIPLQPIGRGRAIPLQTTKVKLGLYEVSSTQEEWAEGHFRRLRNARAEAGRPLNRDELITLYNQDREWVNDDSGLITLIHRDTAPFEQGYHVFLLSDDRHLARQVSNSAFINVCRIDVAPFVVEYHKRYGSAVRPGTVVTADELKALIRYGRAIKPCPKLSLYIDSGSLAAAEAKLVAAEEIGKAGRGIYTRTLTKTTYGSKVGPRKASYRLNPITKPPTFEVLKPLRGRIGRERNLPTDEAF